MAYKQGLEKNKGASYVDIWEEHSRQRNAKCKGPKVSWRIRMHRLNKTIVRYFSSYPFRPKVLINFI